MPQQPRGRRQWQQLLLPGRLRRVGAAGAAHMTSSGAKGWYFSAGSGVLRARLGPGQGLMGSVLPRTEYAAHKQKTA